MSSHFAMLVSPSPAKPALLSREPAAKSHCTPYPQLRPVAGCDEAEAREERTRLRTGLAGRVLSGPGLWMDWLEGLDRRGLLEALVADGVIDEAVATAPHGHKLDRTLNAKTTLICVLVGCLFPGEGYDTSLRTAFGLPGLGIKPGTKVPTGPAYSKARALLGEQVMRRIFEFDAARTDIDLGIGSAWHEMETTAFDGTTAEVFNCDELAGAFGVPTGGIDPDAISFTAVLCLVRARLQADTCCLHGSRRTSTGDPLARLIADVLAHPRNRTGRTRTSGRTAAERRTRHTEEAIYTITITPSNLPKWDQPLGS